MNLVIVIGWERVDIHSIILSIVPFMFLLYEACNNNYCYIKRDKSYFQNDFFKAIQLFTLTISYHSILSITSFFLEGPNWDIFEIIPTQYSL